MAETNAPADNGIVGSAPLYVRPEPLNPENHGALGVNMTANPYGFAARQHFFPVVASEFPAAASSYPVIFAGSDYTPVAVLGLNQGENLFFSETEAPVPNIYIPAYVRRYPFTVAADESAEKMIVCIDRGSSLVTEDGEAKFFQNNELTEYGQASVSFCETYERDRVMTDTMVQILKDLDLFESREITQASRNPDGSGAPVVIASFFAISEEKLKALPIDKLAEIRPMLGAIYAHLLSLFHWEKLVSMAVERSMKEAGKPN